MAEQYSNLIDATDAYLVKQTLEGNMSAYDEIVRRYQQLIASSLYHLVKNQADLEDLVQDTFIRTYQKLEMWSPKAPLHSWIRRIGHNLAYDYLRKQKRNPLALKKMVREDQDSEDEAMERQIAESQEPGAAKPKESGNDFLEWLLSLLNAEQAMLLTMMYVDQLSVVEIAERLGWGESKVKVRIHRTRNKLKQFFETDEELKLLYSQTI